MAKDELRALLRGEQIDMSKWISVEAEKSIKHLWQYVNML